jgi:hypothetical protein
MAKKKMSKERADKRFTSHEDDLVIESKSKEEGMTVFVSMIPDSDIILIRARAEGPGGMIGDYSEEVLPGGSAFGLTYDELFNNLGELVI